MDIIRERDLRLLSEKYPEKAAYQNAVHRFDNGEPLAYLLGEWYFYDETYWVTPDCLIPRPDTEILVEYMIRHLPQHAVFSDFCTGSGCVAISTLVHRSDCTCLAVDLSEKALNIARKNAERNGVSDRIRFLQADILSTDTIEDILNDKAITAVSANPPYIQSHLIQTLSREVQHEPRMALDGGVDGLTFYRHFIRHVLPRLPENGFMAMEIGYDQKEALLSLHPCEIIQDYGGNDRVAVIRSTETK